MITLRKYDLFSWIDVYNPNESELHQLKTDYKLTSNVIEDSMESGHIPKYEEIGTYTFIILRAYNEKRGVTVESINHISGKVAFFVNEDTLITIHNSKFEFLETINYCNNGILGLMLDIIEVMMKSFEPPLNKLSNKMLKLEKEIFVERGNKLTAETLYTYKSTALVIKRIVQFSSHVLSQLTVNPELDSNLQNIKETVVDNQLQAEEIVDDALTLLDVYLSISAQRTNDIMKLLTVFSAFFLPLTFITGFYGMNFENMPGLESSTGFFITLGFMIAISILILIWFKSKKIF